MSNQIPPSLPTPCPECSGERVVAQTTDYMSVYKADTLARSGSSLKSLVCTNCGYTVFYAVEPARLKPNATS